MLVKIKEQILPSIGTLHELALRYIFESLSLVETRVLEEGIVGWSNKTDFTPDDRWEIRRIINALEANERGHFNRAKEMLKKNKWHYRQLYKAGLPYIPEPRKCRTFGRG